jgi:hypothetical protein
MTPDIKRILVPLDFSANSTRALDYAHGLRSSSTRRSTSFMCARWPSLSIGAMDAYAIAYSDWSQRLGEEAERQLTEIKTVCAASRQQPRCFSAARRRRLSMPPMRIAPT